MALETNVRESRQNHYIKMEKPACAVAVLLAASLWEQLQIDVISEAFNFSCSQDTGQSIFCMEKRKITFSFYVFFPPYL